MLPELWEADLTLVFVGTAVTETSETLGFYHLHPRDRFWELLEVGGITPKRILTLQERKALADGHKDGSLSDPVRVMFIEKKTSHLLKLGVGLTDLNRRVVATTEKDKFAEPTEDDVREFIMKAEKLHPKVLAFTMDGEVFMKAFKSLFPNVHTTFGRQPFTIGRTEVWLLGSTVSMLRGEALAKQEDAFFALGERITALNGASA